MSTKCMLDLLGVSSRWEALVESLIQACTSWGQLYTGRDFATNEYIVFMDEFEERLLLRRSPVATIDMVNYVDESGTAVNTVDTSVYYFKRGTPFSEIILRPGECWPTDVSELEASIRIFFTSGPLPADMLPIAVTAIQRHVTYMFENRGDCGDCGECADAAGVKTLYSQIKIPRI